VQDETPRHGRLQTARPSQRFISCHWANRRPVSARRRPRRNKSAPSRS